MPQEKPPWLAPGLLTKTDVDVDGTVNGAEILLTR